MRGARFGILLCLAALGLWGGCNQTPTLPLPPPVAEVSAPDMQGMALVEGEVNPRAFVFVFNSRTEAGVITRADLQGHFTAELEAASGDPITVWQQIDDEPGERKETVVPQ